MLYLFILLTTVTIGFNALFAVIVNSLWEDRQQNGSILVAGLVIWFTGNLVLLPLMYGLIAVG